MSDLKRSRLNQFLDGCPEWVRDEVWGKNGMRGKIEVLESQLNECKCWLIATQRSKNKLAEHLEQIRRAYLNAAVDIQVLFELQPPQSDNSYLVDGEYCTELARAINQPFTTGLAARVDVDNDEE